MSSQAPVSSASASGPQNPTHIEWLCWVEVGLILSAAPFLLFPNRWSPAAAALLLTGPFLRWALKKRFTVRTPLDWPILGLLAMLPVALAASADVPISLPKFYGLLLEIAAFYWVVNYVGTAVPPKVLAYAVAGAGIGLALVGPMVTDFGAKRLASLDPIYGLLPRLPITFVSSHGAVLPGVHPNELAGSLTMVLPLIASLVLFRRPGWHLAVTLPAVMILGGAIVLSASRGALMSGTLTLLLLVLLRSPRTGLVPLAGLVIMASAGWFLAGQRMYAIFLALDTSVGAGTWEDRVRLWDQSVHLLQSFPFTGIGLNTFPVIVEWSAPLTDTGLPIRLAHAHNVLVQTGLDLGIPGLAFFFSLLFVWFWTMARALPRASEPERAILYGCLGGVVAYLGFGMTDALTLGAKPTIVLWLLLGLGIAICKIAQERHAMSLLPAPRRAIAALVVGAIGLILLIGDGVEAMDGWHLGIGVVPALAAAFGAVLVCIALRWLVPSFLPATRLLHMVASSRYWIRNGSARRSGQ